MKIGSLTNSGSVVKGDLEKRRPSVEINSKQAKDTFEISDEARIKLADLADTELRSNRSEHARSDENIPAVGGEITEKTSLSGEKIDEIRKKIESGFYDSPEIKGKIVDKIIDDIDEG